MLRGAQDSKPIALPSSSTTRVPSASTLSESTPSGLRVLTPSHTVGHRRAGTANGIRARPAP
jgi:hypothetical protein